MEYGRTWWGQQWLKALDRIDFENRLPRGRTYANTGRVKDVEWQGHVVRAKVQGTQRSPYDVSVVVPPFQEHEKEILLGSIKKDPLLISRLLNRQLPQELLTLGEENKIKIFPAGWQDIKLNCSCPDWAVPCKHLAAVIYTIANEIDQNPFHVFNLRNLKLTEELSKFNIQVQQEEKEKIFTLADALEDKRENYLSHLKKAKVTKEKSIPDFSTIENLQQVLPLLFTSKPLFFNGDFREKLQERYRQMAKAENARLKFLKSARQKLPDETRYFEFTFEVDYNMNIHVSATATGDKKVKINFEDLLVLLATTESKHLGSYHPTFNCLYRVFRFCNITAERSALLPRLLSCGGDNYRVQWIPAMINDSVRLVFEKLLTWYTSDFVKPQAGSFYNTGNISENEYKQLQKGDRGFEGKEALMLLCSAFYANTSTYSQTYATSAGRNNETDQKVTELFFRNRIISFTTFSEKEIPNTIQLWLNRFFMTGKRYAPLLKIEELEEGFAIEVFMRDNTSRLNDTKPLKKFLDEENVNQFEALKNLQLLGHYLPGIDDIIRTHGKEKARYNMLKFSDLLRDILPVIKMLGIQVLLPKSLQNILHPQITLSLKPAKGKNKKYMSLQDLLSYDWKIAMGDTVIDPKEFFEFSNESYGLVKLRNGYVMMDEQEIKNIIRKLEQPVAPQSFQLLQAALSEDHEGARVQIDNKLRKMINDVLQTDKIALPSGLKASLRPYQLKGYAWMYKNAKLGLGSLIADDMGLGKTLQVITTLLKFKQEGLLKKSPALVVAPASLLTNWKNEILKFAPAMKSHIYHGAGRQATFKGTDVVITTYGMVRGDNETFSHQKWHAVVIDEAQNIKNPETAQTRSVKKIKANVKIAMSGTPVENRLMEYWSIFDFANNGYLGNTNWFNESFAKPIELNQDQERLSKFRKITAPFILRRMKTDKSVINDLPDKIENNHSCSLTREQAAVYKNVTHDLLADVETAEGINRRGLILKLLTALKQICNHPQQYLKTKKGAIPEHSGKMMLLLQLLDTIYENDEKVLIFTQYQETARMLLDIVHKHFSRKALMLHGGTSRKDRDDMVNAFQNSNLHDTFILSLKAGGTGLNLTAANHVVHFDLWWNPAVEAQATDRAFRIGQKKNVMVHRLISKGTLEEKIDQMIQSKKKLANMTVNSGEKWIGELNNQEIKELVLLGD